MSSPDTLFTAKQVGPSFIVENVGAWCIGSFICLLVILLLMLGAFGSKGIYVSKKNLNCTSPLVAGYVLNDVKRVM